MYTLTAKDCHSEAYAMQAFGLYKESEVASSLKQRDYKDATDLVCGVDCRNLTEHPELYPTLQAKPNGGQSLNYSGALRIQYIVRRLTPTECCRLQGFPDWWEDGVEGSDSARYKMWGNGMALPNMLYVMQGIKATEDKRRGFDVWVRSSGHWG
jgi:DNA (cytosine-5)-methyltransferase 1